jgi:hypothetical protein
LQSAASTTKLQNISKYFKHSQGPKPVQSSFVVFNANAAAMASTQLLAFAKGCHTRIDCKVPQHGIGIQYIPIQHQMYGELW